MAKESIKSKAQAKATKAKQASTKVKAARPATKVNGFMTFIREQGVVGLAVGLAIGTQAGAAVKAIVEGFINPLVAFIVGSQDGLLEAKWTVVTDWHDRTLVFGWGLVVSALITLIAVAAVIYYVVKGLRLDKLDKKKDA
jgi:large-conductance mechanosensitive channel